jgi:hypothetical protein
MLARRAVSAFPRAGAGDWFFRVAVVFVMIAAALYRPGFAHVSVPLFTACLLMNIIRPNPRHRFSTSVIAIVAGILMLGVMWEA